MLAWAAPPMQAAIASAADWARAAPPAALAAAALAALITLYAALRLALALAPSIPYLDVDLLADDAGPPPHRALPGPTLPCYDPGTGELLGHAPAMSAAEVDAAVARAAAAAEVWARSPFSQRRALMRILLRAVVDHQDAICAVSTRDSGKPAVDAAFGELIVSCEKLAWLLAEGERWLRPERRSPGVMQFYKKVRVEWAPVGVVGAIVPFNYPFHNMLNPLAAALFAGNALVVKASEHAAWSALRYARLFDAALAAAGAPPGLVQVVTGGAEAGAALAGARLGKLVFVGSTAVGRRVLEAAAPRLTPVVLELGGKDAFVVCDDADLGAVIPTALRGAFQGAGQNCMGAERFIVHEAVYEDFVGRLGRAAASLRCGPASPPGAAVDVGALCLPGLAERLHALVEDARAKGARVLAGGALPAGLPPHASFYPPTVVADVTPAMRLWREEAFGPVAAVAPFSTDAGAAALANDCAFGLGCSVFSGSRRRAAALAARIHAGMASVNDFASTYMAQSLPFGGVKESGYDRFAGAEGLRGLCSPRAVAEDRWPFATALPPLLRYPVGPAAAPFVAALVRLFYAPALADRARGLAGVLRCLVAPPRGEAPAAPAEKKAA